MDEENAYRWLWWTAFGIGCAALIAVAFYYYRHRDRSFLADFAPHRPEASNGTSPLLAPADDVEAPQGVE